MPKAKLTEDEMQANFTAWLQTPEALAIDKVVAKYGAGNFQLELATIDIWDDYQAWLDALFDLVQELKVPGRKAKGKLHISLLTPFSLRAAIRANDVLREEGVRPH